MRILLFLSLLFLVDFVSAYFSKYYGRHKVRHYGVDPSQIIYEKVYTVPDIKIAPTLVPQTEVPYDDFDLINYRYLGAGASGEVFLMQDPSTNHFYVAKRYFESGRFHEENYVMEQMKYPIWWMKDPVYNNTMSIFPHTNARNLKNIDLSLRETKVLMYKTVRELAKAHDLGFFHMDIKPINIVVDSVKEDGRWVTKNGQITIIDWNLVNFYYLGAEYMFRRGTNCYQAPELILWSKYFTPLTDVWSLGATFYYMLTGEKLLDPVCSDYPIEALLKFMGVKKFKEVHDSLNVQIDLQLYDAMHEHRDEEGTWDSQLVEGRSGDGLDTQAKSLLRMMLEPDPEQRATMKSLLNHPFFADVKNLPAPYVMKNKKKKKRETVVPDY